MHASQCDKQNPPPKIKMHNNNFIDDAVPLSAHGSVQTDLQSLSRRHCQGPHGTCCTPEGPPLWAGTFERTGNTVSKHPSLTV